MVGYLLSTGIIAGIYALLTLGLNLQYGFTGLINFGHVAFFAIGAYTSALLVLHGAPVMLGLTAAAIVAALLAGALGMLCLRLRADYLAIVTLSFSEIVRIVIVSEAWLTNGTKGLAGIPRPFDSLGPGGAEVSYLAIVVAANVVGVLLIVRLIGSPFGRVIQAIRDDQDAVRSLGKDASGFKLTVFMVGGGFAGVAGSLYAHYLTYISPDQFIPLVTFYVWIAMIIGGAGRISGALAGTGILMLFLEGSRFLRDIVPAVSEVQMASVRLAAVGLALILFTLYRPQGLIGGVKQR